MRVPRMRITVRRMMVAVAVAVIVAVAARAALCCFGLLDLAGDSG
jgi:hypothetical protein